MTLPETTPDPREVPSLAALLQQVATLPNFDPRHLKVARSAANTLSKLLDLPLDEIPAHRGWIARQIRRLRRATTGLSRKTLSNVKCDLIRAINATTGRQPRSADPPLATAWQDLYDQVPEGFRRWHVKRVLVFLSSIQVRPDTALPSHGDALLPWMQARADLPDPRQRWRTAVRAWNWCVENVPSWPNITFSLPAQRRQRWTLPEDEFLPSLRDDVNAWIERLARGSRLSQEGPRRPLRPETLKHRRHQLFKVASAAVFAGVPIDELSTLADLVNPTVAERALQYLLDRNGKQSEALAGVAAALVAVARHHVKMDQGELDKLKNYASWLDPEERGLRRRNRERLDVLEDERNLAKLLHLPAWLLTLAMAPETPSRSQPVYAQMAIAVEVLLFAPLRRANLTALRLGVTLRLIQVDGRDRFVIDVPAEEVKNRVEVHFELPPDSTDFIRKALNIYHQPDGFIFPGRGSGPKDPSFLGTQIFDTIWEFTGLKINAHLFRHIAAVLHLRTGEGKFEDVRALLHDRDDGAVRESYSKYADRHLIRRAQATITNARLSTPDPFSRPRRRGRPRKGVIKPVR